MKKKYLKGGELIQYVYHKVPGKIIDNKLIPLNTLKHSHHDLYMKYVKKYDHPQRAKMLKRRIPMFNCLWNDVIHFLMLHPFNVYNALTAAGLEVNHDLHFFKVPITRLKNNQNAVCIYTKKNYKNPLAQIQTHMTHSLHVKRYEDLSTLSQETMDFYEDVHRKSNRFGLFTFIPHLLSYGEVDISDVDIISWRDRSSDS
ncbi:MAG TPA: group-specific protein [Bacillota bacterium]